MNIINFIRLKRLTKQFRVVGSPKALDDDLVGTLNSFPKC